MLDGVDNCPNDSNADQANNDGASAGDACDTDDDNDGVPDTTDNCQFVANLSQADWNSNGIGDACEDTDGDSWTDVVELYTGSNQTLSCAATTEDQDEATNATPTDMNNDRLINILDLSYVIPMLHKHPGEGGWDIRMDYDMNGVINILDLSFYVGRIGDSCTP